MAKAKSILILCTGNSARSQMAEGLLKHICKNKYKIFSAGTQPSGVRAEAIEALAGVGIHISRNRSKSVDEFVNIEIDYVLTVCDKAREQCPYFPAKTKVVHHAFEDPATVVGDKTSRLKAFKNVRDEINTYLPTFLK